MALVDCSMDRLIVGIIFGFITALFGIPPPSAGDATAGMMDCLHQAAAPLFDHAKQIQIPVWNITVPITITITITALQGGAPAFRRLNRNVTVVQPLSPILPETKCASGILPYLQFSSGRVGARFKTLNDISKCTTLTYRKYCMSSARMWCPASLWTSLPPLFLAPRETGERG